MSKTAPLVYEWSRFDITESPELERFIQFELSFDGYLVQRVTHKSPPWVVGGSTIPLARRRMVVNTPLH